jgi:hypothetical protein
MFVGVWFHTMVFDNLPGRADHRSEVFPLSAAACNIWCCLVTITSLSITFSGDVCHYVVSSARVCCCRYRANALSLNGAW